jgi:hypothetical protein
LEINIANPKVKQQQQQPNVSHHVWKGSDKERKKLLLHEFYFT